MKFFSWRQFAIAAFAATVLVGCQQATKTGGAGPDMDGNGTGATGGDVVDPSGDMSSGIETKRFNVSKGVEYGQFENIHFEFDSAVIRSGDRSVLEGIAKRAKENPELKIRIEGHCDERGTREYNRVLGQRRALAARGYLVHLGVGADRLGTVSFGSEKPEDSGHSEEAWTKNRRDVFGVVK